MRKIKISIIICLAILIHTASFADGGESVKEIIIQNNDYNTSIVDEQGDVWGWGYFPINMPFGNQESLSVNSPTKCELNDVIDIATEAEHSLALKSDGTVWGWGSNGGYQAISTNPYKQYVYHPEQIEIDNIIDVEVGGSTSIALKNDGTVWNWGVVERLATDPYIENGSKNITAANPRKLPLENIKKIFGGKTNNFYAIDENGDVWAWGDNYSGQLGIGTINYPNRYYDMQYTPVKVEIDNVIDISKGQDGTIFLKADGTVWQAGYFQSYRMYTNNYVTRSLVPKQIHIENVVAVGSGNSHHFAIKSDGTLWGWGSNHHGELGVGYTEGMLPNGLHWSFVGFESNTSTEVHPRLVPIENVVAISGGNMFTVAVKSDGTVWSWGYNGGSTLGVDILYKDVYEPQKTTLKVAERLTLPNIDFSSNIRAHNVTVFPTENGQITVDKISAFPGTIINLTIAPDDEKQLVSGSLKYNDKLVYGTSFIMPNENVVVTGNFENLNMCTIKKPMIFSNNHIDLKYPKNFILFDDKSVPPFPSGSKDDWAKELQYWASTLGIKGVDYTDALNLVNQKFAFPYITDSNQVLFDINDSIKVQDVMEDIVFLGYLQKYIEDEEDNLLDKLREPRGWFTPSSIEMINSSSKTMLQYANRYNNYVNTGTDVKFDPLTLKAGVEATASIIDNVWESKVWESFQSDDYNVVLDNMKVSKLTDMFYAVDVVTNADANSVVSALSDVENNNELIQNQNDIISFISTSDDFYELSKDYSNLKLGRIVYDSFTTIYENNNSVYQYATKSTDLLLGTYDFIKLIDAPLGPVIGSAKIFNKYLDFAKGMYSYIADQYPAWLFYSNYYLPSKYPQIFNDISFSNDGTIELFTSVDEARVLSYNDPLLEMLAGSNTTLYNMSIAQDAPTFSLSDSDRRLMIMTAAKLGMISNLDIRDLQEQLIKYAIAESAKTQDLKKVKVGCPVDIILKDELGNVLFVLHNGEEFNQNYNQYCTFYLEGDQQDEKVIVFNADYNIEIVPFADGEMTISTFTQGQDSNSNEYSYDQIPIKSSSKYALTFNNNSPVLTKLTINQTENIPISRVETYPLQISLYEKEIKMNKGDTTQLSLLPNYEINNNIKWKSSNEDVAIVDEYGNIFALNEGESVITIFSKYDNSYDSCDIYVVDPNINHFKIDIYAGDGGIISAGNEFDYLAEGTILKIGAFEKVGYNFVKWSADGEMIFDNQFDLNTTLYITNSDTVVYAEFEKIKYKILFDSYGGTPIDSQQIEYLDKVIMPSIPKKTGYSFDGWYTDEEFTNEYDFNLSVARNISLHAKWCKVDPPQIIIGEYVTSPTNLNIEVTATSTSGTLNASSHVFLENGSFEFIAIDKVGNVTKETVVITNIDKELPVIQTNVDDWGVYPVGFIVDFSVRDNNDNIASVSATLDNETIGNGNIPGPGVYQLHIEADDYAGNKSVVEKSFIIYDSEGGFVTGGGWINSPKGAYTRDVNIAGRATFGFVSKYKKGATIPTGQTEFEFVTGNMEFYSTSYDWLVIAGSRAQYKGKGTINGQGEYGFMLTAIDGELKNKGEIDRFRIKIWDFATDEIIYDNQLNSDDSSDLSEDSTILGGGSIVIHK